MCTTEMLRACILVAGCFCCWHVAAAGRVLNEQDATYACARSGYVFIPCQEPAADQPSRVLYTFTTSEAIDKIQQKCEGWKKPPGICAAFTTTGILFTPDSDNGRIGSFVGMDDCQISDGNNKLRCSGTYVFAGSMAQQQNDQVDALQAGITDASSLADINNGVLVFVTDDKGVTSVAAQLRARYVRQGGATGPGKVGIEQCSLC